MEFAHEMRSLLARSARDDIPADVLQRLNHSLEELDR
jgi:hypothetical protein